MVPVQTFQKSRTGALIFIKQKSGPRSDFFGTQKSRYGVPMRAHKVPVGTIPQPRPSREGGGGMSLIGGWHGQKDPVGTFFDEKKVLTGTR